MATAAAIVAGNWPVSGSENGIHSSRNSGRLVEQTMNDR
jgi:hypothetical protein